MNTLFPRAFRRLFLPALALLAAATAPAQTIITTAPYTITQAGLYRLGGNLSVATAQTVISISAPNVDLDLGGYTLTVPLDTNGTIALTVDDVSNVTIRNGTVAGATNGIVFFVGNNSRNHLVENLRVAGSYSAGIVFTGASPGSVLRNNVIVNVGNLGSSSYGIYAGGGLLITDNAVGKVTGPSGGSYGIVAQVSDFIVGNTVNDCAVGIRGGKCLNNLTTGCITPFLNTNNVNGNN